MAVCMLCLRRDVGLSRICCQMLASPRFRVTSFKYRVTSFDTDTDTDSGHDTYGSRFDMNAVILYYCITE